MIYDDNFGDLLSFVIWTFKPIQIKMCLDCTKIKAKETIEVQSVTFSFFFLSPHNPL